jgi:hypothetical protein
VRQDALLPRQILGDHATAADKAKPHDLTYHTRGPTVRRIFPLRKMLPQHWRLEKSLDLYVAI